jgi:L-fuconolactonase
MKIDSHQHFWRYNPQRDTWITDEMSVLKRDFMPEDLLPELQTNEIDGCVAVQADQSEQETQFLLRLADQHPEIKGVVGWVNLCVPEVGERLAYFSQFDKLRGVRHIVQSEPDDRYMLRREFCNGIGCLKEFALTYDILIHPKQLSAAIELVARFPEQRFVIDHIAKPEIRGGEPGDWAVQMRIIATSPNVYCKLSGLITEADWANWRSEHFEPYLDIVFQAFSSERLMFGSDWPVCLLAGRYEDTRKVIESYVRGLAPAEREAIFGLNAAAFYGLKN